MPSQFSGLMIGYSGLTAYQAAENTTANNIANVYTDGYSKQVVNQTAESALRTYTSYGMAGMGVSVNSIDQLRNGYLDMKYWANQADVGRYSVHELYTSQIENYFKESNTLHGFESVYSEDFYTALSELEKNPYSDTARIAFIGASKSLTEYFNTMSDNLTNLQKSINLEIKTQVERVNAIAEQISNINKQINSIEITGHTANELRDKRNLLIDELSEIVDVTVDEQDIINKSDPNHNLGIKYYRVSISNGCTLVDGYEYNPLECISRDHISNQTDAEGLYDIYWKKTGNRFLPTANNLSGSLKALLELRDGNNLEALVGKGATTSSSTVYYQGNDAVNYDSAKNTITVTDGISGSVFVGQVLGNLGFTYPYNVGDEATISVNGNNYKATLEEGFMKFDGTQIEYTIKLDTPLSSADAGNLVVSKGSDSSGTAGKAGDTEFTMVRYEDEGIDLQKVLEELDIPVSGIVTISGSQYNYDGFSVELTTDASGKPVLFNGKYQYKYTFENLKYLKSDGEYAAGLRTDVSENAPVYVGQNIDYQGIPYYQSQMSLWVRQFAATFNETELFGGDTAKSTYGYDANGSRMKDSYFNFAGADGLTNDFGEIDPADSYATKYRIYFDGDNAIRQTASGGVIDPEYADANNFLSYYNLTAGNFSVGEDIVQDCSIIATTTSEISNKDQSDNDLVVRLEQIKTDKNMMKFRGASSSEFLNKVLADMALNSNNARTFSANTTNIKNVISNQRLSISGVDEDEEALDLVKFQHAYELNSKVIQVMTEIYDRLILETGV
ncbi:MAG: flagellar hook-associated protein FlgK [Lachnospiraceae bacterium]|nr:flagellar hook-associated protein FlgK [Lachnospiraceae bacterium]